MQRILIQALPREGVAGRPRCKRFWPSDKPVAVDVVDDEESPTVEAKQRNPHTGAEETILRPDPVRINRKDLEAIKADPILRIMADGETMAGLSQAALDAARRQASQFASDLIEAKARLAGADEKVADLKAAVVGLEAANAKLKAELAALNGASGPSDPKGGKAGDDLHPHLRKDEVEDTTLPDSPSAKARKAK